MELKGKIIVFDGDSICSDTSELDPSCRGWAARVGRRGEMEWYNYAVGGGTITAEMYSESTGAARHWISRTIDKIHNEHPRVDYLILEGGTNDADLHGIDSDRFGTYDPSDFSGNFDDTTYTGGLESLFYKALSYYPQAKIGYIVAQKMGPTDIGYEEINNRRFYFLRAIEICKKWGVPYIDLWESSPINPALKCYYDPELDIQGNIDAGSAYRDGQHLTALGYDMIENPIYSWIKSL